MQPPCMSSVVRFYCMPACVPGLHVPYKAVINRTTAKVLLARVVWNLLAAAEFSARRIWKATERTLSELVMLSCVVFVLRHFVELFRMSTAEWVRCCSTSDISPSVSCRRERCCTSFDIFSRRVTSSWTLVFNADHQLDDHRESRETSTEAAGSYRLIWSGRTVSSDLDCWTRTRRQNSSSRFFSSLVVEVRVCRTTPEDR